jgi:hypothetical protein
MTATHCTHSSDALCLACDATRQDAYLKRHSKNPQYPHPDRHVFLPDDSGLTCQRCEVPSGNRIHQVGGF